MSGNLKADIPDEVRDALKARVRMVATELGIKTVPRVQVYDIKDANAVSLRYVSPGEKIDDLKITLPLLDMLTPRELNTVIAHELQHREDSIHRMARELKKTGQAEISSDDNSVRAWGDPEAYKSALIKMENYHPERTDADKVRIAAFVGLGDYQRKFSKGSEEKRAEIIRTIHEKMAKVIETDTHLPLDDRLARINEVAKENTPAMRARQDWSDRLDAIETAAGAIATGTSQDAVMDLKAILFKATGREDIVIPAVSPEEAKSLGQKLLDETKAVRDERPGHTMETIAQLASGQTPVIPRNPEPVRRPAVQDAGPESLTPDKTPQEMPGAETRPDGRIAALARDAIDPELKAVIARQTELFEGLGNFLPNSKELTRFKG